MKETHEVHPKQSPDRPPEYSYTHTFTFDPLEDILSDYSNVGRIFTERQMRDAEGIPEALELPAGEWVKLPPERIDSFGRPTVLKYEYWWKTHWEPQTYERATV